MDTKTDVLLAIFFVALYLAYLALESNPALLWSVMRWINGG